MDLPSNILAAIFKVEKIMQIIIMQLITLYSLRYALREKTFWLNKVHKIWNVDFYSATSCLKIPNLLFSLEKALHS